MATRIQYSLILVVCACRIMHGHARVYIIQYNNQHSKNIPQHILAYRYNVLNSYLIQVVHYICPHARTDPPHSKHILSMQMMLYLYIYATVHLLIIITIIQESRANRITLAFIGAIQEVLLDYASIALPHINFSNLTHSPFSVERSFFSCRSSQTEAHFR